MANERSSKPTVAVVTGAGGIKTFGAVALYELLEEIGLVPDLLVGCSGGALMTGLLATGYRPADMIALIPELMRPELFSAVDYRAVLGIPFGRFDLAHGLIKPDGMRAAHEKLFGVVRLEELPIPTLIQVTDFQTGAGCVLERGRLADAVYASGAVFPALPMLELEGRWLTDGAYSSPCPVLEAVQRNIDVILAVTIETQFTEAPQSWLEMFNLSQYLCTNTLLRNQLRTAINLHHYEIIQLNLRFDRPVEFWQLDQIPFVLETGRRAVAAQRAEILAALHNFPAWAGEAAVCG